MITFWILWEKTFNKQKKFRKINNKLYNVKITLKVDNFSQSAQKTKKV